MAQKSTKAWGGRFRQATDPAVERFTASIHFDRALARYDLRLSAAHARMLRAQGLIDAGDERRILEGLDAIGAEVEANNAVLNGVFCSENQDVNFSTFASYLFEDFKPIHTGQH